MGRDFWETGLLMGAGGWVEGGPPRAGEKNRQKWLSASWVRVSIDISWRCRNGTTWESKQMSEAVTLRFF